MSKIAEFKLKHAAVNPEAGLSAHGKPIRHADGRIALAGDLVVGKTYALDMRTMTLIGEKFTKPKRRKLKGGIKR